MCVCEGGYMCVGVCLCVHMYIQCVLNNFSISIGPIKMNYHRPDMNYSMISFLSLIKVQYKWHYCTKYEITFNSSLTLHRPGDLMTN